MFNELGHSSAGDGCPVQAELLQVQHGQQGREAGVCHLCVAERQLLQPGKDKVNNSVNITPDSQQNGCGH